MRTVLLIFLVVAVCGCNRALIYTGSVKVGDNQKAIAIAKIVEAEFSDPTLRWLEKKAGKPSSFDCFHVGADKVEKFRRDFSSRVNSVRK